MAVFGTFLISLSFENPTNDSYHYEHDGSVADVVVPVAYLAEPNDVLQSLSSGQKVLPKCGSRALAAGGCLMIPSGGEGRSAWTNDSRVSTKLREDLVGTSYHDLSTGTYVEFSRSDRREDDRLDDGSDRSSSVVLRWTGEARNQFKKTACKPPANRRSYASNIQQQRCRNAIAIAATITRSTMLSRTVQKVLPRVAARCFSSEASAAAHVTLNFSVPHESIYKGASVFQVIIPGVEGEYGVTPNHVPYVAQLKPGVLQVIHEDGAFADAEKYFVAGGYALTHENSVTVS